MPALQSVVATMSQKHVGNFFTELMDYKAMVPAGGWDFDAIDMTKAEVLIKHYRKDLKLQDLVAGVLKALSPSDEAMTFVIKCNIDDLMARMFSCWVSIQHLLKLDPTIDKSCITDAANAFASICIELKQLHVVFSTHIGVGSDDESVAKTQGRAMITQFLTLLERVYIKDGMRKLQTIIHAAQKRAQDSLPADWRGLMSAKPLQETKIEKELLVEAVMEKRVLLIET